MRSIVAATAKPPDMQRAAIIGMVSVYPFAFGPAFCAGTRLSKKAFLNGPLHR